MTLFSTKMVPNCKDLLFLLCIFALLTLADSISNLGLRKGTDLTSTQKSPIFISLVPLKCAPNNNLKMLYFYQTYFTLCYHGSLFHLQCFYLTSKKHLALSQMFPQTNTIKADLDLTLTCYFFPFLSLVTHS